MNPMHLHIPVRTLGALCVTLVLAWSQTVGAASPINAARQQGLKTLDYYEAANQRRLKVVDGRHWQPGVRCLSEHNYRCAIDQFDFILGWFPNHPHALDKMGRAYIAIDQPTQALPYFDAAVTFRPNYAPTYLVYGTFLHRIGEQKKAAEMYEKALELDPDNAEAHYNLGLLYFNAGDYERSKEHARRAYELDFPLPGLKDLLKSKGVALK